MAIKTFVDGGKQTTAFYNDTEPVQVYVDGVLQENVSFLPQSIEGQGSLAYKSEYKKNQLSTLIKGNSAQVNDTIYSVGASGVSVVLSGKNKLNVNVLKNGSVCTVQDGVVTLTKTSSDRFSRSIPLEQYSEGTRLRFSLKVLDYTTTLSSFPFIMITTKSGNYLYYAFTSGGTRTIPVSSDGFSNAKFYIQAGDEVGAYVKFTDVMLEVDADSGVSPIYEPYIEPTTVEMPISIELEGQATGRNLASAQLVYANNGGYLETELDGRECVRVSSGSDNKYILPNGFKPNTQYTVSFVARGVARPGYEDATGTALIDRPFVFMYTDGTFSAIYVKRADDWNTYTLTSTPGKTVAWIGAYVYDFRTYTYIDSNTFMLEEGTSATEYQAYTNVLPLLLAKIGDNVDTLLVDRVNSTVKYNRIVGDIDITKSLEEQEVYSGATICDLTSIEFAQALLKLPTQNLTNEISVEPTTENINVPSADITVTYAKWGNAT